MNGLKDYLSLGEQNALKEQLRYENIVLKKTDKGRKDYLQNLQLRPKWIKPPPDIVEGDVVLMKENEVCRNSWPLRRVVKGIRRKDDRVRQGEITIYNNRELANVLCPVMELVRILSRQDVRKQT